MRIDNNKWMIDSWCGQTFITIKPQYTQFGAIVRICLKQEDLIEFKNDLEICINEGEKI